jgi:dethiobiotin synthetase
VLVPIVRETLFADLFATWGAPVVLVARTALGTINHSLLSIEALRARGVPILGIAFIGEAQEDSEATICRIGRVRRLGRLPRIDPLEPAALAAAFAANFDLADFA